MGFFFVDFMITIVTWINVVLIIKYYFVIITMYIVFMNSHRNVFCKLVYISIILYYIILLRFTLSVMPIEKYHNLVRSMIYTKKT